MNRSWFRNPFSGSSSNSNKAEGIEEDGSETGEVLMNARNNKRKRRRGAHSDTSGNASNVSFGEDYSSKENIPPLPAATSAHAHGASLHSISSIRTAHFANEKQFESGNGTSTEVSPSKTPDRYKDRMSWASTASGMIGFDDDDKLEAAKRFEEAAEADESERQDAYQVAVTSRSNASSLFMTKSASRIHLVGIEEDGENMQEEEEEEEQDLLDESSYDYYSREQGESHIVKMTPSRSSTSLKSILKKSTASKESTGSSGSGVAINAEFIAVESTVSIAAATPARTVTFSPSTHPAAPSPPETSITPEHPRARLQNKQQTHAEESPIQHRYVTDPTLCESDESQEVEEALLSRTSNTPSPPLRILHEQADSSTINNSGVDESNDSLRLLGSASKKGAGFLNRMHAFIPSPDVSLAPPSPAKPNSRQQYGSNEVSNLLDVSVPTQLHNNANETTIQEDKSKLRSSTSSHSTVTQNGPKQLMMRKSTIFEEPSSILSMKPFTHSIPAAESALSPLHAQRKASTSPLQSPTAASPPQDFHSFAASVASPNTSIHTPSRESMHSRVSLIRKNSNALANGAKRGSLLLASSANRFTMTKMPTATATVSVDELGRLEDVSVSTERKQDETVFMTPERSMAQAADESRVLSPLASKQSVLPSMKDQAVLSASPQQSLVPLPTITPSSSSSSLLLQNQESPFSTLINHLLGAQSDLLSHRADQKTLLMSLIANMRGELASRDRKLDILEKQKNKAEREVSDLKTAKENQKKDYQKNLEDALKEVERNKESLLMEVSKRESKLQDDLQQERQRNRSPSPKSATSSDEMRNLFEKVEQLEHDNNALRSDLEQSQQAQEAADAQAQAAQAQVAEAESRKTSLETELDEVNTRCQDLEGQLSSAEMQITRLSSSKDKELLQLRTQLEESEAYIAELKHKVDDTTHALEHERTEQAKQYDYSASVQEELRQHNDTLLHSISELEDHHSATQKELSAVKKESAVLLQENEERITHLETEILKRSTERRKLVDQGCIGCREHEDRNTFLESEVVRLRDMVSKMRLESADREVKVARLNKARDQLKEDIDGLNIALEAKQQEVHLLKRGSSSSHFLYRQSSEVPPGTSRPSSRIIRTRPSSTHDTILKSSMTSSIAPSNQRNKRPDSRRISFGTTVIETPSVAGGTALISSAVAGAQGRAPSTITANKPSQSTKAYEAASLMKGDITIDAEEKENSNNKRYSGPGATRKQLADLPNAPQHLMAARERVAKRQMNSVVAMHA